MSLTAQQAARLISDCKDLLLQIDIILHFNKKIIQDAVQEYDSLKAQSKFLERARREVFVTKAAEGFDTDMAVFLQKIFIHYACQPIVGKEMQYLVLKSRLEGLVSDLTPRTKSLQWLFAGRDKKVKAEQAALYLQENLTTDVELLQISRDYQTLTALRSTPLEIVWQQYEKTPQAFLDFTKRWIPEYAQTTEPSVKPATDFSEFTDITDTLATLQTSFDKIPDHLTQSQTQIKNAVDRMVMKKLLDLLSDIPVDELNREKAGIRIKTLKDYKIDTVAAAYTATTYQLESIPGISWEGACLIKDRAKALAEEAQEGIRIRLSADEQTEEATAVIGSIYTYRQRLQTIDQANRLQADYAADIKSASQQLELYKNAVNWFYLPQDDKNNVIQAYDYLNQNLHEDYGKNLATFFDQIRHPSFDQELAWQDFSQKSIEYFNILEEIVPGILGNEDGVYGLPEELAREIADECFFPEGLDCTLRRYQEWGVKYALHQERVLLGDEMGLGKTVQAIATMVSLKNTGATHFVVVCPASVLPNWCKEIVAKSKLRVLKIHGKTRDLAIQDWVQNGGVAVTTFETTGSFFLEDPFRFSLLIVDEAHYVKNPEAARTINMKRLSTHADRMLFMTGTALENRVDEMISLVQILQPDLADQIRNLAFLSTAPQFREKIAPVYYRRKREEVLNELPDLIETKEWCSLSLKEQAIYETTVLLRQYAQARQVSWNVSEDLKNSSKAARMLELIQEAEADGRKVIVFSFFLETIRKIKNFLGDRCTQPINGSIPPSKRQQIIDEFDKAPAGSVLLAQIQAGGTGLNIQSASVVILCEPQFKPSVENQAISRAYRMGQSRNVLVYRLLAENTIDEKIMDMLAKKQEIFDQFADSSVSAAESFELDDKTFGDIIAEEIQRIQNKNTGSDDSGTNTDVELAGNIAMTDHKTSE